MLTTRAFAPLLATLCGLVDCSKPTPPAPPPETRVEPEVIAARMRGHFEEVLELKAAVVDAELETVREQADYFVGRHESDAYPLRWRPFVVSMLASAEAAAASQDLAGAARAVALVSASCGACHQALSARPRFVDSLEPEPAADLAARMQMHRYATDRMWEGIIGPSDADWRRGTELYAVTAGCSVRAEELAVKPYLQAVCNRVHVVSARARAAVGHDARTEAFGEILSSCAACHDAHEKAARGGANESR